MGQLTAASPSPIPARRLAHKALQRLVKGWNAGGREAVRRSNFGRQVMRRSPGAPRTGVGARLAHGFTMLEVLVAMLVAGIGVLGVAGLAALNLQHNRAAAAHHEAVLLARDLLERIRANPAGLAAGAYAGNSGPSASVNCTASVCAPSQTAAFDLAAWRCALGAASEAAECAARMNGQGAVSVDAATGTVRVIVSWRLGGAMRTVAVASRG